MEEKRKNVWTWVEWTWTMLNRRIEKTMWEPVYRSKSGRRWLFVFVEKKMLWARLWWRRGKWRWKWKTCRQKWKERGMGEEENGSEAEGRVNGSSAVESRIKADLH